MATLGFPEGTKVAIQSYLHLYKPIRKSSHECLQLPVKNFRYFHCSAALVIAYIMETYGLTYRYNAEPFYEISTFPYCICLFDYFIVCEREAFLHVQNKRFCINPNEGFVQQLMVRKDES